MNSKFDGKLLETVAFSNGCICFAGLAQWEHTHFHVSGSLMPSEDDVMLTDRMVNLCSHIGIPLLDHVIVGGNNQEYFSFRKQNILPVPKLQYENDYQKINFSMSVAAERGQSR